jgi:hypothetical protein
MEDSHIIEDTQIGGLFKSSDAKQKKQNVLTICNQLAYNANVNKNNIESIEVDYDNKKTDYYINKLTLLFEPTIIDFLKNVENTYPSINTYIKDYNIIVNKIQTDYVTDNSKDSIFDTNITIINKIVNNLSILPEHNITIFNLDEILDASCNISKLEKAFQFVNLIKRYFKKVVGIAKSTNELTDKYNNYKTEVEKNPKNIQEHDTKFNNILARIKQLVVDENDSIQLLINAANDAKYIFFKDGKLLPIELQELTANDADKQSYTGAISKFARYITYHTSLPRLIEIRKNALDIQLVELKSAAVETAYFDETYKHLHNSTAINSSLANVAEIKEKNKNMIFLLNELISKVDNIKTEVDIFYKKKYTKDISTESSNIINTKLSLLENNLDLLCANYAKEYINYQTNLQTVENSIAQKGLKVVSRFIVSIMPKSFTTTYANWNNPKPAENTTSIFIKYVNDGIDKLIETLTEKNNALTSKYDVDLKAYSVNYPNSDLNNIKKTSTNSKNDCDEPCDSLIEVITKTVASDIPHRVFFRI